MNLRPYASSDAEAVAALYRAAVLRIGPEAYGPDHVQVWASFADDTRALNEKLSRGLTVLAEEAGRPAAFGQLEPSDHVEFLYCHPDFARRGFAGAVYAWLEMFARQQGEVALTTEASRISRPFFEKMGFEVVEPEYVERSGLTFERFRMRKAL